MLCRAGDVNLLYSARILSPRPSATDGCLIFPQLADTNVVTRGPALKVSAIGPYHSVARRALPLPCRVADNHSPQVRIHLVVRPSSQAQIRSTASDARRGCRRLHIRYHPALLSPERALLATPASGRASARTAALLLLHPPCLRSDPRAQPSPAHACCPRAAVASECGVRCAGVRGMVVRGAWSWSSASDGGA